MGYPTRVQLIQRQASQQWYLPFPAALARALGLHKGEVIEWNVQDRQTLVLRRSDVVPDADFSGHATAKKKRPRS
jgi:antitoxin component of MazEF toxin-antitoxin module